eukprot:CAMPEP_0179933666 /NCGR_PEP_ID=MMETSP0983-20121128/11998_1 /TAXON_ID=483367 /ORGANISM="non described non described, Strain CCMP 2436" /LENGTH=103 /DNA_ID=CAMNT_0021838503 /DNA_START=186 /DNA_END=497 /DNA_ORIENTATION=-
MRLRCSQPAPSLGRGVGVATRLVEADAEANHAVDAPGEGGGLVQAEARVEKRCLVQQLRQLRECRVLTVHTYSGAECFDDRVLCVYFENFARAEGRGCDTVLS